jgi:hypothetical protein
MIKSNELSFSTFKLVYQRDIAPIQLKTLQMNQKDMKTLKVKVGSKVCAHLVNNILVFEVWPSKSAPVGSVVINRALKPNFIKESEMQLTKLPIK